MPFVNREKPDAVISALLRMMGTPNLRFMIAFLCAMSLILETSRSLKIEFFLGMRLSMERQRTTDAFV